MSNTFNSGKFNRVTVLLPSALREEAGGATEIAVEGKTVFDTLQNLQKTYPGIYRSVCDETGAIRQHVNLFVNESFLHQREGLQTILQTGDTLSIMPAVSGG